MMAGVWGPRVKRDFYDIGVARNASYLAKGAERHGAASVRLDLARKCERPVGFQQTYTGPSANGGSQSLFTDLEAPCRRCPACRRARQNLWTARAKAELGSASRTWFATLTVAPSAFTILLARARVRAKSRGYDYDAEPSDRRFTLLVGELQRDVTRYLKRVRKSSGAKLRYMLVVEQHKSGLPHMHGLVHEVHADLPVRKSVLRDQWDLGFTKWKLVDASHGRTAHYVCKYLSKDAQARVRASIHYGRGHNPTPGPQQNDPPQPSGSRGVEKQPPLWPPVEGACL